MNTKKIHYLIMAGTGLLAISLVICLSLGLNILRKHSDGLAEVNLESQVLQNQQTNLAKAQKAIDQYSELNDIARTIVPKDKDQARTVRDISTIAGDLNIKLSSITFPASSLGDSKKTTVKETQVSPVKNIKGVYQMQITVQQDSQIPVSYGTFLKFLERLESNRRTAQVTNITITPSTSQPGKLSFNLTLGTYIKP